MYNSSIKRFYLGLILGLSCLPLTGYAVASIDISPITLTLLQKNSSQVIKLTNLSDEPQPCQVHSFSLWQQDKGKEIYTPTRDIIVLPPAFTIQPKESQVIRVAYLGKWNFSEERAYRIFLHEIPHYEKGAGETQVGINLNISLPMFVEPPGPPVKANLSGSAFLEKDKIHLNLKNTGAKHGKIKHLLVTGAQNKTVLDETMVVYVLPGAAEEAVTQIDFHGIPGPYQVTLTTDDYKTIQLPIVVAAQKSKK